MSSLKLRIIAIAGSMLFSTATLADECDSKAAEAAAKIGGKISYRLAIGTYVEHPSVETLAVMCEDHKAIGVVAESRKKTPSADYYETVGLFIASAFPPITSQEASSESLKCLTMALSREREWAYTETKGLRFQCRSDSDGSVLGARPTGIASGLK